MTDTTTILEHHLEALEDGDMEEIMADYDDESVVVTNMGTFRGTAEIEALFEETVSEFPDGMEIDMDQQTVEGDFAYIVWQAESPESVYEFATDTMYIPEETIRFQTAAVKVVPKE